MASRRNCTPGDPLRAISYRRVSTQSQDIGLDAQEAAINTWAQSNGVCIVGEFVDRGTSGAATIEERPGLAAALDSLRGSRAGLLLVHKRDRLARSVFVAAVAEKLAERNGASIVTVEGVANGNTPEEALLRQVIDAIAQFERATIRGRILAAMKVLRRQGRRTGGIPYGHRLSSDGVHLEEEPTEQEIVHRVKGLRREGCTYAEIAQDLVESGFAPRSGGRWYATTLKRIVEHTGVCLAEPHR